MGNLSTLAPQKWLCRLGPWSREFEPGQEGDVVDWAQQKTGYWEGKWDDQPLGMRQHYIRAIRECVYKDGRMNEEAFGRSMRVEPLPLIAKPLPVNLPRFYEWSDMGAWTDVETDLILEDENGCHVVAFSDKFSYVSVFLRLDGGRYCVADLATREQASALAAVIMSASTWFVPAK